MIIALLLRLLGPLLQRKLGGSDGATAAAPTDPAPTDPAPTVPASARLSEPAPMSRREQRQRRRSARR